MHSQVEPIDSVVETDRLFLRRLCLDDAGFIVDLLNQPSFIKNIGDKGVRNNADAERYLTTGPIASYQKFGFGLYLVATRVTGVPIGICGLLKRESLDDVDIGFAFLEREWGNGYALEAAKAVLDYGSRTLGLDRIVAITLPENQASIRVLEKIGLSFVRVVPQTGLEQEIWLFGVNFTRSNPVHPE